MLKLYFVIVAALATVRIIETFIYTRKSVIKQQIKRGMEMAAMTGEIEDELEE